jgi:hypothetical protein
LVFRLVSKVARSGTKVVDLGDIVYVIVVRLSLYVFGFKGETIGFPTSLMLEMRYKAAEARVLVSTSAACKVLGCSMILESVRRLLTVGLGKSDLKRMAGTGLTRTKVAGAELASDMLAATQLVFVEVFPCGKLQLAFLT